MLSDRRKVSCSRKTTDLIAYKINMRTARRDIHGTASSTRVHVYAYRISVNAIRPLRGTNKVLCRCVDYVFRRLPGTTSTVSSFFIGFVCADYTDCRCNTFSGRACKIACSLLLLVIVQTFRHEL